MKINDKILKVGRQILHYVLLMQSFPFWAVIRNQQKSGHKYEVFYIFRFYAQDFDSYTSGWSLFTINLNKQTLINIL